MKRYCCAIECYFQDPNQLKGHMANGQFWTLSLQLPVFTSLEAPSHIWVTSPERLKDMNHYGVAGWLWFITARKVEDTNVQHLDHLDLSRLKISSLPTQKTRTPLVSSFMASHTECVRCNISNIVKLRRTCMWRKPGSGGGKKPPRDVPPGHVAVTVGEARRRFVIRADYLNHPLLQQLLDQAYEEYGQSKEGPLAIPCDEFLFQNIIHSLASQFSCNVNEKKLVLSLWKDSGPLLNGFSRGSTC